MKRCDFSLDLSRTAISLLQDVSEPNHPHYPIPTQALHESTRTLILPKKLTENKTEIYLEAVELNT